MNQTECIHTRQASVADIALLAPLFDAYRVFYGKSSDLAVARAFLQERFQHKQSILFVALRSNGMALRPPSNASSENRAGTLRARTAVPR